MCSKGFKGAPSNTLKLFPTKCFFLSPFIKYAFGINSGIKKIKKMHVTIKTEIFDRKFFKLQRFGNVFPNIGGNGLFWRGH